MKRILPVYTIALFLAVSISAYSAVETLDLSISEVTVYPNQAQVTRFARQELPAGEHTFVIENLPLTARDESFRVSVSKTAGLKLLGFNHKLERKLISTQDRIAEMEKQIEDITRNELEVLQSRLETYKEQKGLVLQLSRSAGKTGPGEDHDYRVDISQWQSAFDFVGTSLDGINDSIRTTNNEIVDVNRRLDKLREDLRSIQITKSKTIKTVRIDLRCDQLCAL